MNKNNSIIKTAIIYYCYNRIDHTKKSLKKILDYKQELPLYIFCDGSYKKNDIDVDAVKKFVIDFVGNRKDVFVVFRNKNLGLAQNVINGVNKVFSLGFEAVIVLEDDCVIKKQFFNFMLSALDFYNNNSKIMHVSGFGIPLKNKPDEDYYITPYPCSWGWGTWKKHWDKCDFDDNIFYEKILNNTILKDQFDWTGKSFSNFLSLQLDNKVNSWLIRWYAHIFKNKGLCLWATNSKLKNIGFDGTGQHKVRLDRFNQKFIKEKPYFEFKNDNKFDFLILKEFKQYFMGPKLLDKIKTVIYMYTGLILGPFKDYSDYYKD